MLYLGPSGHSGSSYPHNTLHERQETIRVAIIIDGGSYLSCYERFTNTDKNRQDLNMTVKHFKAALQMLSSIFRNSLPPTCDVIFEQVDFFHATTDGQPQMLHRLLQVHSHTQVFISFILII